MSRACVALLLAATLVACALAACENDCSGHGQCTSSNTCACDDGWEGSDCSQYKCAEHADGCSGHGQCRDTGCVCHAGYGGHNCAAVTTNCPDHCKGHGACLDGVCSCDAGYTGTDCGIVDPSFSCPNNCSGHGFCEVSGETPTCFCMPSFWSGVACDVERSLCPSSLNNCTGHGICGPKNPLDESSQWECACEAGFCGASCNRTCPECPNNCTGHGICLGNTCQCDKGFAGDDCTLIVEIPECPNNCSGHGRCLEGADGFGCVCEPGYEGSSCVFVDSVCPGNCSGKGECRPDGTCACIPGYNGTACQQAIGTCAASNNCSANGICVDGACHCFRGFSGFDCSMACHTGGVGDVGCNADRGHGVCVNGTCVCKDGEWEGVGCEIRAHDSTMGSVASSNNPIGVIVLSVLGAAVVLVLAGAAFNYSRGKRGINALPGVNSLRSTVKGDDYEAAPENRYASNY